MLRLECIVLVLFLIQCRSIKPQNSQPEGFVTNADDQWSRGRVEVCWTGSKRFPASETNIARTIQREYGALGFTFYGWKDCPENVGDRLAVNWADGEPSSRATIGLPYISDHS